MIIKLDPISGKELTLKCIQVIFRHGARTPLNHVPEIEEVIYEKQMLSPIEYMKFRSSIVCMDGLPVSKFKVEDNFRGTTFKGGATAGQLTGVGRIQCYQLGLRLGRDYRQLITDSFDPSIIWMRASPYNRCVDSLRCVLAGMFSENMSSLDDIPIKADVHRTKMVPMIHEIPPYKELAHEMLLQLGKEPMYKSIQGKLDTYFGVKANAPRTNEMILLDHIRIRQAHKLFVPDGLLELQPEIENVGVRFLHINSGGRYNETENGLKLCIGRLVNTLAKNFEAVVANETADNKKPPSAFMFSAHDSTLAPILEIFGCFDGRWPDFASDITLELYEDDDKNFWVQVLWLNKPVLLRHHSNSMVELGEFLDIIQPFRITYEQFLSMCQENEQS